MKYVQSYIVKEYCSAVFIINFEHISHLFLVFQSLTFGMFLFAGKSNLGQCSLVIEVRIDDLGTDDFNPFQPSVAFHIEFHISVMNL